MDLFTLNVKGLIKAFNDVDGPKLLLVDRESVCVSEIHKLYYTLV